MGFAVSMVILFQKLHCTITNKRAHSFNFCAAQNSSLSTLTPTDVVIFSVTCSSLCNVFVQKQLNRVHTRRGQTTTFKYYICVMFCYLPRVCPSSRLSPHHFLSVAVRTKCTAVIAVNNLPRISQNVKFARLSCT